MYAVVDIAGHQVRADKGQRLRVPKLNLEAGAKQTFTDVVLLSGEGRTLVGTPLVAGATVEATVVGHGRGQKIIIFKMRRRKNYRRRNGHRQDYTEIQVDQIVAPN